MGALRPGFLNFFLQSVDSGGNLSFTLGVGGRVDVSVSLVLNAMALVGVPSNSVQALHPAPSVTEGATDDHTDSKAGGGSPEVNSANAVAVIDHHDWEVHAHFNIHSVKQLSGCLRSHDLQAIELGQLTEERLVGVDEHGLSLLLLIDEFLVSVLGPDLKSLINGGSHVCSLVAAVVQLIAHEIDGLQLVPFLDPIVSRGGEADDLKVLGFRVLVVEVKVVEHGSVGLVDDHEATPAASFAIKSNLIGNSLVRPHGGVAGIGEHERVALLICSKQTIVEEHDGHVKIGVLQDEVSQSRVNPTLTLASWDNPDLPGVLLTVQSGERGDSKLIVVDANFSLSEHVLDRPVPSHQVIFKTAELLMPVKDLLIGVDEVCGVLHDLPLFLLGEEGLPSVHGLTCQETLDGSRQLRKA